MVVDAGILLQADDFGVTDVGSVQKGAEEEQGKNGKNPRGERQPPLLSAMEKKYRKSSFSRIVLTCGEFSWSMARGSTAFSIFSSAALAVDIVMLYI
jgi:hypothetical protein